MVLSLDTAADLHILFIEDHCPERARERYLAVILMSLKQL